jgi:hypothetical protein
MLESTVHFTVNVYKSVSGSSGSVDRSDGDGSSNDNAGGGAVGGGAPYVTGETIFLGLNNYMRSHGYGELIPSRR